ncbi:AraC family transcriptional regulator [Dyadobacter sp. 676]|uniref:AraC family transcriptional regulator n=1 Tax=Dyadobacter sp. 676 TaxID=3088362 RepID=A0AAU8FH38_9BACT
MEDSKGIYAEERIAVPDEFANVFSYFYTARNDSAHPVHKTLIPSFQTIIAFNFGSPARVRFGDNALWVEQCIVLGPLKRPIEYILPPDTHLLVVNFRDDAFYRFFGPVMFSEMIARHPDELLEKSCFSELWLRLKNESPHRRPGLILDFCRPYLRPRDAAFECITEARPDYVRMNAIRTIAQETGQSERNVQLNHKKYLGYTAKERSRYQKFLNALRMSQGISGKADWHQIAEASGYYDQSQLIHDFRHFMNVSPGQYLKFQAGICQTAS